MVGNVGRSLRYKRSTQSRSPYLVAIVGRGKGVGGNAVNSCAYFFVVVVVVCLFWCCERKV